MWDWRIGREEWSAIGIVGWRTISPEEQRERGMEGERDGGRERGMEGGREGGREGE